MRKALLWAFIGGIIYYAMEGVFRWIVGSNPPHPSMMVVGGLCFVLVGGINQIPAFFYLSMRKQAVIGTMIVLVVEYVSGCVLNLWLGLGIWDYSHLPLNLHGQVCILFAGLWFLLMPFAIWLEDWLQFSWFYHYSGVRSSWDYSLKQAYWELVSF